MNVEILHSSTSLFEGEEMCPHCNNLIKQCPIGPGGPECSCGFIWSTGKESFRRFNKNTKQHTKSYYAYVTRR